LLITRQLTYTPSKKAEIDQKKGKIGQVLKKQICYIMQPTTVQRWLNLVARRQGKDGIFLISRKGGVYAKNHD
jgi:hypothetical protein